MRTLTENNCCVFLSVENQATNQHSFFVDRSSASRRLCLCDTVYQRNTTKFKVEAAVSKALTNVQGNPEWKTISTKAPAWEKQDTYMISVSHALIFNETAIIEAQQFPQLQVWRDLFRCYWYLISAQQATQCCT